MDRSGRLVGILIVLVVVASLTSSAAGVFVGGVVVDGWVLGPGEAPVEGATVEVVGMEEFNATTDGDGYYSMQVPFLEVGHTLSFEHTDLQRRQVGTGPLVEDGWVTVNVTMVEKAPRATLTIQILPWDQPGSNYGLRQDVMTVENMDGTPDFEWSETSSEEEVVVPAPGTYMVTATRPGYYPLTEVVTVDRGDRITVALDMTGNKKPTYGWVNGTVEDDGFAMPFVTVVAEPVNGTRTYQAVTGTDGSFSMQLPNGTYRISVETEGYAKLSEGVDVVLGEGVNLHFPMTVKQETGDNGNPLVFWSVLIAVLALLGSVIGYAMVTRRRTASEEAEEAARKEELRCPSCDALASPEDDSCLACGAAFPWKSFRCPDCGAVIGLDETRCPECGNQTFDLHRG
ncbi:MAG: carboxypeptidase regulatory-like domain-containing protein [Thermoplasmata archaeon]|nr:MAG: carboxypeptidase regulatory-like domain-containing protein [Thermoplasmata archaeon]